MMRHNEALLYTWEWQKFQISLDFANAPYIRRSLEKLYDYVWQFTKDDPMGNRLYRAITLLQRVRANINRRIKSQVTAPEEPTASLVRQSEIIRQAELWYMDRLNSGMVLLLIEPDNKREDDFRRAFEKDRETFDKVYCWILMRSKRIERPDNPALFWLLDLMSECYSDEAVRSHP